MLRRDARRGIADGFRCVHNDGDEPLIQQEKDPDVQNIGVDQPGLQTLRAPAKGVGGGAWGKHSVSQRHRRIQSFLCEHRLLKT